MQVIDNRNNLNGHEAVAYGSFVLDLAIDESASINQPCQVGHVLIAEVSTLTHGLVWFRSNVATKETGGANLATLNNTVLTGTTGTAGNLTVSTSGNKFYIENRTVAAITVVLTFFGISFNRM